MRAYGKRYYRKEMRNKLEEARLALMARQKELWESDGIRAYLDGFRLVTIKNGVLVEIK